MKTFKTERDWSDLERADKTVIFIGVLIWALLTAGCLVGSNKYNQIKSNAIQSEKVR